MYTYMFLLLYVYHIYVNVCRTRALILKNLKTRKKNLREQYISNEYTHPYKCTLCICVSIYICMYIIHMYMYVYYYVYFIYTLL